MIPITDSAIPEGVEHTLIHPFNPLSLQRLKLVAISMPLLIAIFITPASALESFATYPPLPVGYQSIKVFDRQSRFVGRIVPDKRFWVPIERIPTFLQKAVVAVEDARFYEHAGIDLRGIARAAVKNVVKRRLAEGGSTITQQLIKNKYLSSEKSLDRKVNEGLLAIEFEQKYTKQQILEMYFNEIYYGNGAWGIAQAARLYFDKNPEELSEAESVLLAGIPKNPGRYNPWGQQAEVGRRRDIVVKRLAETGLATPAQLQVVRSRPAVPVPRNQAPYYLAHIRSQLIERSGAGSIERGGLEVTAALELPLQTLAEQTLREGVHKITPQLQGALVAVDPVSGDLLAAVGGTDFATAPYNRAILAHRQPGSAIKPLIYAAAMEQGITAASLWDDTAVEYPHGNGGAWKPQNYDSKSHGQLTLRQALASSNNVIAVKLLDRIGLPAFIEQSAKHGLLLQKKHGLSLALGTEEVTLHDLVMSYTPFAHGGLLPQPRSIIRIFDSYTRSWSEQPASSTQPLSAASAFITTQMLKDVVLTGTGKGLKAFAQQRPVAGKTGTTSDYRDAWFIGYSPQLVTGVWVGYDLPRPGGKNFTGGSIAAPIWERFMRQALHDRPVADFIRPDTVVSILIDPSTGLLATPDCPKSQEEFFLSGTEPDRYCSLHSTLPPALPDTTAAPTEAPNPE